MKIAYRINPHREINEHV